MANQAKETLFPSIFAQLHMLFQPYEEMCRVSTTTPDQYMLNLPVTTTQHKEQFFGGVQIKKNYVSYHLMPVYLFPQLLDGVSDRLKKRMQGKSCFNFAKLDEELLDELAQLTKRSVEQMWLEGLLTAV